MKSTLSGTLFALIVACPVVLAHHGKAGTYDLGTIAEIEGEVTRILWRNPHTRFWIETQTNGVATTWEIESTPPSILARYGIGPDIIEVGQTVRFAGNPGLNGVPRMEVTNLLMANGQEVLLQRISKPRWADRPIGYAPPEASSFSKTEIEEAEASANGIFRVWSRDFSIAPKPGEGVSLAFRRNDHPLTANARTVSDSYDPLQAPVSDCTPDSMPMIMSQPFPVQFVDEGERLLLHLEEYDLTRIIHLTDQVEPESNTLLGHSLGRWESENVLVLTTTAVASPQWSRGVEMSGDVQIEERFEVSQDETRLDYKMSLTDPATFTEPVTLERFWLWRPGETLLPYECSESDGIIR